MLDVFEPLYVGDGNCLYRAVSLAIYGTQAYHHYLRICTSMEPTEHCDVYDVSSSQAHADLHHFPCAPVDNIIHATTKSGESAEMAHVYALSAALGVVIHSYMPACSSVGIANPCPTHVRL